MGLEQRGSRVYFYHKQKRNGCVRSVYAGAGDLATLQARLATLEVAQREIVRAAETARREAERAQERQVDELGRAVRAVVGVVLVEAGYHQHHRGVWRRRREGQPMTAETEQSVQEQLGVIVNALAEADKTPDSNAPAVQTVRDLVREMPRVIAAFGDLHTSAIHRLLDLCRTPQGQQLSIQAKVDQIRKDLGAESAPPLDQLLIDNVAICWLRFHLADLALTGSQRGQPLDTAEHYDKLLSAAHRRYIRSIEALARVRKLGDALQVNVSIAGQQLNVQTMGE